VITTGLVVVYAFVRRTVIGRQIYVVGGNAKAAKNPQQTGGQLTVIWDLAENSGRGFVLTMAAKAVGTDEKIRNYRQRYRGALDCGRGCGLCDRVAAGDRCD
jgi:hypothetical protein